MGESSHNAPVDVRNQAGALLKDTIDINQLLDRASKETNKLRETDILADSMILVVLPEDVRTNFLDTHERFSCNGTIVEPQQKSGAIFVRTYTPGAPQKILLPSNFDLIICYSRESSLYARFIVERELTVRMAALLSGGYDSSHGIINARKIMPQHIREFWRPKDEQSCIKSIKGILNAIG